MQFALIAAVAENGVIGRDNTLPWHLPKDLAYFKQVTMGKPILMGRKTFESIGRPLPGRCNIVISRNQAFCHEGVHCAASVDEALQLATEQAHADGVDEAFVIGGAEIYAAALPMVQRLYLTEVHAQVSGDALFPEVNWSLWREVKRTRHLASGDNPFDYSFVVYERVE